MQFTSTAAEVVSEFGTVLSETWRHWRRDRGPMLGAALAFYSIFSTGPLIVVAIAVAGLAFGEEAVAGQVFRELRDLLGADGASAVQALVASANRPSNGFVASIVSLATLLVGALGVVVQLKDSLNLIWDFEEHPDGGLLPFILKYILSLAAIVGVGFLLTISLVISALINALGAYATGSFAGLATVFEALNFIASFLILTVLFTLMLKYLPDIKVRFIDVLPGGLLTALLFNLGKMAIGYYLGRLSIASAYGAAGSIVVLLIWTYYSAQIFLLGAEFTAVSARRRGIPVSPTAGLVRSGKTTEGAWA